MICTGAYCSTPKNENTILCLFFVFSFFELYIILAVHINTTFVLVCFLYTVISISDSLQFAYRTVMATVTLGLLHNEQGGCMENT